MWGEGMPAIWQAVAGSICLWFPGRRECREAHGSGCAPGGDSLMSDTGLCTKMGGSHQGPSIWVACVQQQPVARSCGRLRFISLRHPSHARWKLEPPQWGQLAEGCAAGGCVHGARARGLLQSSFGPAPREGLLRPGKRPADSHAGLLL